METLIPFALLCFTSFFTLTNPWAQCLFFDDDAGNDG